MIKEILTISHLIITKWIERKQKKNIICIITKLLIRYY